MLLVKTAGWRAARLRGHTALKRQVPISLSSLSDRTGGSGSGGEAFVGGGAQGQPPYVVLQSHQSMSARNSLYSPFCKYWTLYILTVALNDYS